MSSKTIFTRVFSLFCAFLMLVPDALGTVVAIKNYHDFQDFKEEIESSRPAAEEVEIGQLEVDFTKEIAKEKQKYQAVYPSREVYGVIGKGPKDRMDNPGNDIFSVMIDSLELSQVKNVYLRYDVFGVSSGNAIPKGVNQGQTQGDLDLIPNNEWTTTKEALNREDLKQGINHIRFSLPEKSNLQVEIKNVMVLFSEEPIPSEKLQILHPEVKAPIEMFSIYPEDKANQGYLLYDIDVPSIPANIVNTTAGAYSYGIKKDNQSELIGIKIDKSKISPGYSLEDVKTYYFSYEQKKWVIIELDSLDTENEVNFVPSQGATQYFNGLIKTPEMPEASAFAPTQISDLKAANPAEGMNIMQHPSISQSGDANISYPLAIPAGRNGLTPQLALNYNSAKGTGWLGMGWDISTPKVTVDTRWGVPTYDPLIESELYSLNGSDLVMEGNFKANKLVGSAGSPSQLSRSTKSSVRFFPGVMQGFKKIERINVGTQSYVWVETSSDNTKFYYGTSDGTTVDSSSTLRDVNGNIAEWYLKKIEDKWGNYIEYKYTNGRISNFNKIVDQAKYIVLDEIVYTGHKNTSGVSTPGNYLIKFNHVDGRDDGTSGFNYGFKTADQKVLNSIDVKYSGTTFRSFHFTLSEGEFKKQILTKVEEKRNGVSFYSHEMEYYEELGASGELPFTHKVINPNLNPDLNNLQQFISSNKTPTSLGFSTSDGYSAGLYVGVGPMDGKPNKIGTMGLHYTYGNSHSNGKVSIMDVNGDGIKDFISQQGGSLKYHPTSIEESTGTLEVQSSGLGISGTNEMSYTRSHNHSFGFQGNYPALFVGVNTSSSTSRSKVYLTEYNGDGIPDLVDNGVVKFGKLDGTDFSFDISSETTPNPVIKGFNPSQVTVASDYKDFEIVRSYIVPMDGQINIAGNPSLPASSGDGVKVAIQKNENFILPFTDVSTGGSLTINQTVSVVKGDVFYFRTRCKSNGWQDMVSWNPSINYQNSTSGYPDAEGNAYSSSTYYDSYLASQKQIISFEDNYSFTINPGSFSIYERSDELRLSVVFNYYDAGGNVLDERRFTYKAAHDYSGTFALTDFKDEDTPSILLSAYQTTPNFPSGTEWGTVHFEINTESNLYWNLYDWRPSVDIYDGAQTVTQYPAVYKSIYDDPMHLSETYKVGYVTGPSGPYYQVLPNVSSSILGQLSGISTGQVYEATFFLKIPYKLIKKVRVVISSQGVKYFDFDTGQPLFPNTYYSSQIIDPIDVKTTSNFDNVTKEYSLYFEFDTKNEELASILTQYATVDFYNSDSDLNTVQLFDNHQDYSVFLDREDNVTGHNFKGWGQFAWSFINDGYIDPVDVKPITIDQNALGITLTSTTTGNDISTAFGAQGIDENSIKAYPLSIQRYEDYNQNNSGSSLSEDRWQYGQNLFYSSATLTKTGKLGEPNEAPDPPVSTSTGSYGALGIVKVNKSKTIGVSGGVSAVPNAVIADNNPMSGSNGTGSYALNEAMDLNGDRYPDVLSNDGNLKTQFTTPTGGYKPSVTISSDGKISESRNYSDGVTLSGSFANGPSAKSERLMITEQIPTVTWLDVNGDGLQDRITYSKGSSTTGVELNTGYGFQPKFNTVRFVGGLTIMEDDKTNFSFPSPFSYQRENFSFSGGAGLSIGGNDANAAYVDFNGDGLPDLLSGNTIKINKGLAFSNGFSQSVSSIAAKAHSNSASGDGSFSIMIPASVVKITTTINGGLNASLSGQEIMYMDFDGDGFTDILKHNPAGYIDFYESGLMKSNLLKKVTNPLGGSFVLEYEEKGNKYGEYEREIGTGVHGTGNCYLDSDYKGKVYWDMASRKRVLSSVTVQDNNKITFIGEGLPTYSTYFNYDGGVYSRRERKFLGFSRTEVRSETKDPLVGELDIKWSASITDYYSPESNSFQDRVNYEYVSSLPKGTYKIAYAKKDNGDDLVHVSEINLNNYKFYSIDANPSSSEFGKADLLHELDYYIDDFTETEVLYPALLKAEAYAHPEFNSLKHFSYAYDITYNKSMSVTMVEDNGLTVPGLATWVPTGEMDGEDPVMELVHNPVYTVDIIAIMHYFDPSNAAGQVGQLRKQRIFVGDTSQANMVRKSSLELLASGSFAGFAPWKISQEDIHKGKTSTTTLEYDDYGNVTKVTSPLNKHGVASELSYVYDTDNHQFVKAVTNSFGETSYNEYLFQTGQIESTTDINGYVSFFEYDGMDRLHKVYAPREYQDLTTPYTIKFEYFPEGVGAEIVPVAVTTHYLGESATATAMGSYVKPTLGTHATSPVYNDLLQTSTFMDGLSRVVQVKKDVSKFNSSTQVNERYRMVSGWTNYDWIGRPISTTLSDLENTSVSLTSLTNSTGFTSNSSIEYDLLGRNKKVTSNSADISLGYNVVSFNYMFEEYIPSGQSSQGDFFVMETQQEGSESMGAMHTKSYLNSKNWTVASEVLSTSEPTIQTEFSFDELGQMLTSKNGLGMVTTNYYDMFGRAWKEDHPDRGTTTTYFDDAGNVDYVNTDNGDIYFEYDHNRLIKKDFPAGIASDINDVVYSYGSKGVNNSAGRIETIVQGSNVLQQTFRYDELGNMKWESKEIAVPFVGEMTYNSQFSYDSWGRLKQMIYPDGEEVSYNYAVGGELESVTTDLNGVQTTPYDYISLIGYDGFGNRSHIKHGNGVVTSLGYSSDNRALTNVTIYSPDAPSANPLLIKDKTISYYKTGNISEIDNNANITSQHELVAQDNNTYTYDYANRLLSAHHNWEGGAGGVLDYDLTMEYNLVGGITGKSQVATVMSTNSNLDYTNGYVYDPTNKHQIDQVTTGGNTAYYDYNSRGSIVGIHANSSFNPDEQSEVFIWDDVDQLRATVNQGGIHHNIYDHSGIRLMKSSVTNDETQVNGQITGGGYGLKPYTIYVSPYFVCNYYLHSGKLHTFDMESSKHYFTGSLKVASKLSSKQVQVGPEIGEGPEQFPGPSATQNDIVLNDLRDVVSLSPEEIHPELNIEDVISLKSAPPFRDNSYRYVPCEDMEATGNLPDFNGTSNFTWFQYADCLCRFYPEEAQNQGISCNNYEEVYWYHPDYLGNTEYITDIGGYPYQMFYYNAFGESLVAQHANTGDYETPYRFNGKELDPETGLSYYGARYYNPKTSIWLSVDPLASKSLDRTPFHFSSNNPVMRIDPDGERDYYNLKGKLVYQDNKEGPAALVFEEDFMDAINNDRIGAIPRPSVINIMKDAYSYTSSNNGYESGTAVGSKGTVPDLIESDEETTLDISKAYEDIRNPHSKGEVVLYDFHTHGDVKGYNTYTPSTLKSHEDPTAVDTESFQDTPYLGMVLGYKQEEDWRSQAIPKTLKSVKHVGYYNKNGLVGDISFSKLEKLSNTIYE